MKTIFILTFIMNSDKFLSMRKLFLVPVFLFSLSSLCAKTLNVVTTVFPAYDWAKNIAEGSFCKISSLAESGIDIHSFQPGVRDIAEISSADIFIFAGGESDGWAKDALRTAGNRNQVCVNFMQVLEDELQREECAEDGIHGTEHRHGFDEHVWLSVRKSRKLVEAVCEAFCKADSANAELYKTNAQKYSEQLEALDKEFSLLFASSEIHSMVFADRFPFRYFAGDYRLECYSAFEGCSAETEASFNKIIFLANKLDELNLSEVFVIENSDRKIARTIIQNSKNKNRRILTLDTMQAVSAKTPQVSYLGIMKKNLEILKSCF